MADSSKKFGSQCIVVAIDAKKNGDKWEVFTHGGRNNSGIDALEYAKKMNQEVIEVQIKLEEEIASLEEQDKKDFLELEGIEEPALNKIIKKGYEILGLDTFFTAGPNELRAWTLKRGSLAPQAAGRIHTDFERGFIKAEIISFEDYISFGGEAGSKENGKLRLEGKDYIFKDGDIAHFKFNV